MEQETPPVDQGAFAPAAASRVKAPAIALLVVGILDLLTALFALVQALMGGGAASIDTSGMTAEQADLVEKFAAAGGPVGIAIGLFWAITSAVVILGAVKMMKLQSWGLALTGSIVAMIPCIVHPCCILIGIPIGIWSIVVLMNQEVKSAFS